MAKRRKRISNGLIVVLKLLSALGLFFSCCIFCFVNFALIRRDLGFDESYPLGSALNPWYNLIYVVVFVLCVCFVIYYIANMIIRFEMKELWKADRLFIIYQIVFTCLMVVMIVRWSLVNLQNAILPSVVLLLSGLLNLLTPKIVDNDNTDF